MIDWLTLRLPFFASDGSYIVARELVETLRRQHGRILALTADGTVEWETARWESVRSDSHQIAIKITDHLTIQGSPARVGGVNNVFGSDDICECAERMIRFVGEWLGVVLPMALHWWTCTRVDITYNFDLGSESAVRQALLFLKQSEGGHYQSQTRGETGYWNMGSRLRSGKAYGKGAHLRRQVKRGEAQATAEEMELADRLLRLELKLGGQFWRERTPKPWYRWTAEDLRLAHDAYFRPLIGNLRVKDMNENELFKQVEIAAGSKRMARRVWNTYQLMKANGYRAMKAEMSVSTFQRHKTILVRAGIPLSQLQCATVVPLVRHRAIALGNPITGWDDLRKSA